MSKIKPKKKSAKTKTVAVVLFNLGGPDSKNAIKPFLMNFFMDRNIIRLPALFRFFLAKLISSRRSKREAGDSYGELGGKSPLLDNTREQAKALERKLNSGSDDKFKVFIAMRYWHPLSAQSVREVRDWGADEIMLLPLYPQFSTTTTGSSLQEWNKAMFEAGYERPTSMVCCYPENGGFIKAAASSIRGEYEKARDDKFRNIRILFSAHGLPESVIKAGDPYQWQCEKTAGKIAAELEKQLKIKSLDWQICYQSRVGPKKWIGPSLDEALATAAEDGKAVVVFPHAFTQEHVETLVELDIEYKEEAHKIGVPGYYRAATVGADSHFIDGLAGLVSDHIKKKKIAAEGGKIICPKEFTDCCMRRG